MILLKPSSSRQPGVVCQTECDVCHSRRPAVESIGGAYLDAFRAGWAAYSENGLLCEKCNRRSEVFFKD